MNFHIFVLIATIIFYIIFRFYKYQIQTQNNKKKSFLIYVLLIPCLLYLTKFIFNIQGITTDITTNIQRDIQRNIKIGGTLQLNTTGIENNVDANIEFDPILTIPYPESSVYVSSN